ncbi:MAG: nitroreductase [Treponema sp.]|nr:nitroreductase [Treponema sp.]
MNVIEAIEKRRSVRKFKKNEIDKDILIGILKAGICAPSPKNNQPWKFVVLTDGSKKELVKIIENGFENIKSSFGLIIDEKNFLSSAQATLKIMEEAPVIIIVINTENKNADRQTPVKKFLEMANVQSIGASIENMLLAALEYGIGSLWISDIYYTVDEIKKWLETEGQITAAVALGYPDENPPPVKRKEMDVLVEWKENCIS